MQDITQPLRFSHGLWLPEYATVLIHSRLSVRYQRVALAHEIGHAFHDHPDDRPRHESQADAFAALHLIRHDEFEDAVRGCSDVFQVAEELMVTQRILLTYSRMVTAS